MMIFVDAVAVEDAVVIDVIDMFLGLTARNVVNKIVYFILLHIDF